VATLDLLAHKLASSLMVAVTQCFDQIGLAGACLCGDVRRKELGIVALCIKDLADGSVFVSHFCQQWIASRFKQQLVESLFRVQPGVYLRLRCVFP